MVSVLRLKYYKGSFLACLLSSLCIDQEFSNTISHEVRVVAAWAKLIQYLHSALSTTETYRFRSIGNLNDIHILFPFFIPI